MKILLFFLQCLNPIVIVSSIWTNLKTLKENSPLLFEISKRDIQDRYVGQVFGRIWVFLHPLVLMGVFIFLFSYVYNAKLGRSHEMPRDFTTYILAGLVPWLALQEVLSKACSTVRSHQSLVKQIIFPIEILPAKEVLVSYVTMSICFLVLFLYDFLKTGSFPVTYFLIPVLLWIQFHLASGISYFLSAVSVFFKDIKDFVQVFTFVGVYMLPIVFLPAWVPKELYPIIKYNPFSHLIWSYQDTLYYGEIRHPWSWLVITIFALFSHTLGLKVFRRLKHSFGSAL